MNKKLFYLNSKGNQLCAILSTPRKQTDKIVVLVHGHNSSKNAKSLVALNKIFLKNNLATFRIDLYGHGESEGKFADCTISEATDDILQAIKFVKDRGFKKIGLIGSSFGGLASLMAASISNDLVVLGLKSPVVSYSDLPEIEHNNREFITDAFKNNGYTAIKKINIPILVVHGDADTEVPVSQSKKLAELNKKVRLKIIPNANHRYTNPKHFQQMLTTLSQFVISHHLDVSTPT